MRDKHRDVAYMIQNGYAWETIAKEIEKCEVRCANCHRRKTARERGFYDLKASTSPGTAIGSTASAIIQVRAVSSVDRAATF